MTEMLQHVARRAAFFCDSSPGINALLHGYNYRGEQVIWTDRHFVAGHPYAAISRAIFELHPHEMDFEQVTYNQRAFTELRQTLYCALASGLGISPRSLWTAYVQRAIQFDELKHELVALARSDNYDNLDGWLNGYW